MTQKKILSTDDVDDTPVNGVTTEPVSSNWAYDHSVDLDAHNYNILERIHLEHYLPSPLIASMSNTAIMADVLYAMPYPIAVARTTSHIGIPIITGDAGKVARMGLYADNGSCYPGALVADCGEFSVADVELSTNVYVQTLTAGLYWIALLSNGIPTTNRATDVIMITDRDGASPSYYGGIGKASSTYGALSGFDPFPAGATYQYKGTGGVLRFSA